MTENFFKFIKNNDKCFDRSLKSGHITGSTWIVNKDGTHVLLTHHKKLDVWIQPGGHADGDPDVTAVALKEAQEETGLENLEFITPEIFDLDIHEIPECAGVSAHLHYDVRFLLRATGSQDYFVSNESHDLAWIKLHKLSEFTMEANIHRMAEKWRQLRKDTAL